jgi:hypothetical protein
MSADAGAIIYCIKVSISPFIIKVHHKCIKAFYCIRSMKGHLYLCICNVKGEISTLMQDTIFSCNSVYKRPYDGWQLEPKC